MDGARIRLEGARLHNLRGVDIEIPLGALTVVTGVSGSGKSTLVHDVLYRALERELTAARPPPSSTWARRSAPTTALDGRRAWTRSCWSTSRPIGRTPRSNPVTYIKALDEVRAVFARQPLARQRGYGRGHFSFNVDGRALRGVPGRRRVQVEMVFMADVYVPCEVCGGKRYKPETLEVRYKGQNIREVLDLTVDEAIRFFIKEDRLGQALWHLQQVGLGYLRLGQPAPTLSGGEAQRIRSRGSWRSSRARAAEALHPGRAHDRPPGDDIRKLLRVLGRLVDAGHTSCVIEHNLDVIKTADWIIDLGPDAGAGGGRVVATAGRGRRRGRGSHTGRYLRAVLAAMERQQVGDAV